MELAKYQIKDSNIQFELTALIVIEHIFHNIVTGATRTDIVKVPSFTDLLIETSKAIPVQKNEVHRVNWQPIEIKFNKELFNMIPLPYEDGSLKLKKDYTIDISLVSDTNYDIIFLYSLMLMSYSEENISVQFDYIQQIKN